MNAGNRVVGVSVGPEETDGWVQELERQSAARGLDLTIAPGAEPADADYLVFNIDSGITDFTPYSKLRAILNTWAGVEAVMAKLTWPDHVPFGRMVERGMTVGMVEYFLAHTMRYHMGVDRTIAQSANADWQKFMPPLAENRTIGILGLGALGTVIAERLIANGFQVHGWARSAKTIPGATCHQGAEGLDAVLRVAEILCVILPLTPQTENVLNAETLAKLPHGAFIINAGRGPLIDDDALLAALASGHIAHATLDVFRTEPLPSDHPYWRHSQVTVTPHIAAFTRYETGVQSILDQIERDINGQPLLHIVDRSRGY